ncbi:hypothetical protein WJU21_17400 [Emcibacter sp. SYSU 3D8]
MNVSLVAIAAASLVFASSGHALDLALTCQGTATISRDNQANVRAKSSTGETATGTVDFGPSLQRFDAVVQVSIREGHAKVKIPAELVGIFVRKRDGWYNIDGMSVTDEEIRGHLPMMFNPPVVIDRMTGRIEIGRATGFNGQCEVEERPSVPKF